MTTGADIDSVVNRLRLGAFVSDKEFDALLQPWVRQLSTIHWTPIAIARCAVAWLNPTPQTKVLDVGSGAGKFCLVGALASQGQFIGVEQRQSLVTEAEQSARALGASRARFKCGDMSAIDWGEFDAFYFFNPFLEALFGDEDPVIDALTQRGPEWHERCVSLVEERLSQAKVGTRVVALNGYGGKLPETYHLESTERFGRNALRMWVRKDEKRRPVLPHSPERP